MKPFISLLILILVGASASAQDFISKNNFTGLWTEDTSWTNGTAPSLNFTGNKEIQINGEISTAGDLNLGGTSDLFINDTLFVYGNLDLQGNFTLDILPGGILIVVGSLNISNNATLNNEGQVVVENMITLDGDITNNSNNLYAFNGLTLNGGTISPASNVAKTELELSIDNPSLYTYSLSGPLPIELGYFTAIFSKHEVNIKWTTLSEKNNDFFEVQKSENGYSFRSIKFIDGKGDSSTPTSYKIIDVNPLPLQYYRLKQVDFDGTISYSKIIRVTSKAMSYQVYPNPSAGEFKVLQNSEKINQIRIFNAGGIHIKSLQPVSSETKISNLSAGTYFLEITGDHTTYFSKIIVRP